MESTLLKYDIPILIAEHDGKKKTGARPKTTCLKNDTSFTLPLELTFKSKNRPMEIDQQTQDVLDTILPPKEWEENGLKWKQRVSSTPATRIDVINLQEQLDSKLHQRLARETGICSDRRELYSQCFDEIIRQVTITCSARGLLLLRIRDEIKMTMAAYQELYESSIAFGLRKALMAEQSNVDLKNTIENLNQKNQELENLVSELKFRADQLESRSAELRDAEEKKHLKELEGLKKTNQQLKSQLEGIILPKNK